MPPRPLLFAFASNHEAAAKFRSVQQTSVKSYQVDMNRTAENVTGLPPTCLPCSSDSEPSVVCSWYQIVTTCIAVLNLIVVIVGIVWANHFLKKREERDKIAAREREERDKIAAQEREDRDKIAALEREERDKIAYIVSSEYENLEKDGDIPGKFSKMKDDLKKELIFCGMQNRRVNGFDLLWQMCGEGRNVTSIFHKDALDEAEQFQDNVRQIWKLFRSFLIKLPLGKQCSNNIKEALGPLVLDLAEAIAPFVTERKRQTISAVLEYFGEPRLEPATPEIRRVVPYVEGLRIRRQSHESSWVIVYNYQDRMQRMNIRGAERVEKIKDDLIGVGIKLEQTDLPQIESKVHILAEKCLSPGERPNWDRKEYRRINMLHVVRTVLHSQANLTKANMRIPDFEIPEDIIVCTGLDIRMMRLVRVTDDIERHFALLKGNGSLVIEEILGFLDKTSEDLGDYIKRLN